MLSDKIRELELENRRLSKLIKDAVAADIPKLRNCETCKYFRQYYCRDKYGTYYKVYTGHCMCGVPIKERKGKKMPTPEDTCTCFEKRFE